MLWSVCWPGSPKITALVPVRLLWVLWVGVSCSDDPTQLSEPEDEVCFDRAEGRVCIYRFEASRIDASGTAEGADDSEARSNLGRIPWTNLTWEAASVACATRGYRLCTRGEWLDACDGVPDEGGTVYTYGNDVEPDLCQIGSGEAGPTGAKQQCASGLGVLDLSGNVWEWTGTTPQTAVARGGGWRSSVLHACLSGDDMSLYDPTQPNIEVGFRCCRTP